jgi:hypothetical protein
VPCCLCPPRGAVDAMGGVKVKVSSKYVSADLPLPLAACAVHLAFAGLN